MHPTDDLQIRLYRGPSFETLGLDDYLALADDARRALPDPERHVTLAITVDGADRFHARGFGPLSRLVAQLAPARARLAADRPALIRSGVLDVPDGQYVLIEPTATAAARISMIAFADASAAIWFPDQAHGDALYRFVAERRDALVAASRALWPELSELAIDRGRLDAALARDAAAGARVSSLPSSAA